jgi:hypothetical protein
MNVQHRTLNIEHRMKAKIEEPRSPDKPGFSLCSSKLRRMNSLLRFNLSYELALLYLSILTINLHLFLHLSDSKFDVGRSSLKYHHRGLGPHLQTVLC